MACASREKTLQHVISSKDPAHFKFQRKMKNKSNLIKEKKSRETKVTLLVRCIITMERQQYHKTCMSKGLSQNKVLSQNQVLGESTKYEMFTKSE